MLIFGAYALGSVWAGPGPLFAPAAVPFAVTALAMWRLGRPDARRRPGVVTPAAASAGRRDARHARR